MITQFICFLDHGMTGDEERDRAPIAIGSTRGDALNAGIPRGLWLAAETGTLEYSQFVTVAQPGLAADEFAHLGATLDAFFAAKLPA